MIQYPIVAVVVPAEGAAAAMIGGPGSPTTDGSRAVNDGGIKAAGWTGQIDASETRAGMAINDARFSRVNPFQAVLEGRRNSSACRVPEVGSCENHG